MKQQIFRATDLCADIGGRTVLDHLSFYILENEIVGMSGLQNSGIEYLPQILAGRQPFHKGTVHWRGVKGTVHWRGVRREETGFLRMHDLRVVEQETALVQSLSVAENMFVIKHNKTIKLMIRHKLINKRAKEIFHSYGITLDVRQVAKSYSLMQQHIIEIIKQIDLGAKLLVLNHIMLQYSQTEIQELLRFLRCVTKSGVAFVIVDTHQHLRHIQSILQRILILRKGKYAGTIYPEYFSESYIRSIMLGNEMIRDYQRQPRSVLGKKVFEMREVTVAGQIELPLNMSLREHEIVGVLDFDGVLNRVIENLVLGVKPVEYQGCIMVDDQPYCPSDITDAIRKRVIPIYPGNHMGFFENFDLMDNMAFLAMKRMAKFGVFVNRKVHQYILEQNMEDMHMEKGESSGILRADSAAVQTIAIRRWKYCKKSVCVLIRPCQFTDSEMRQAIFREIDLISKEPTGIMILSSDLSELTPICNRIFILARKEPAREVLWDQFKSIIV